MSLINTLAEQGRIWSARHWQEAQVPAIASRFEHLDALLPGGGWPLGAVTEILYPGLGSGELLLVLPALASLSQQDDRWQLWLNPPLRPCGPALQHYGVDTRRLLVAQAARPADVCHSLEKSLHSGGCQAALVWLNALDKALMRRIQLAAEQARVPLFVMRPERYRNQPSVAALRVQLTTQHRVHILKRRAGWPVDDVPVDLPQFVDSPQEAQ